MAHVFERPSLRESSEIVTPSGRRYRWADDEPSVVNVPSDATWSDTMPGGFENAEGVLPRKPNVDYADLERLSTWTRYDAAGDIIHEARLEGAPSTSGDQFSISPAAVGWQAHLDDNKAAQTVIIDRDLTHWREISRDRRLALLNGGSFQPIDASVKGDTASGIPAIAMEADGEWTTAGRPICESVYNAGPNTTIGFCRFSWQRAGTTTSSDWIWRLISAIGDDNTSLNAGEATSDLQNEPTSSGSNAFTPSAARRYMMLQLFWNAAVASNSPGVMSAVYWYNLAVVGGHGLTERGTAPNTGYYDADVIGYVLDTWCPLLNHTTESLTASTYVIQHLAFLDPTTAGEMVRQTTRFNLRDWAVWDNRTFWLHDRDARGTLWQARASEAKLEETGPQVDRLWNGIIVAYQDVDGSTRTVGPTGSGADTETSDLIDTDPENPANKLGIRRWDMLTMDTTTSDGATLVGQQFLEQSKLLDSSGRATVIGHVQDSSGVWHPYSHMRAGDRIRFPDAADTSYRRIVRTEKSRSDRSCSFDLDAPPEGLQALLERLGVVLVPLGL